MEQLVRIIYGGFGSLGKQGKVTIQEDMVAKRVTIRMLFLGDKLCLPCLAYQNRKNSKCIHKRIAIQGGI